MRVLAAILFLLMIPVYVLGHTWIKHIVTENYDDAKCVFVSDINGDNYLDVVSSRFYAISWWNNVNGDGTVFVESVIDDNMHGAYSIYSYDLDFDGDNDVIACSYYDNEISWWSNMDSYGNNWDKHVITNSFTGVRKIYIYDIDSDGDMDVIGAAYQLDEISWWENTDGVGTSWIKHVIDPNIEYAVDVYVADINGDGFYDVLCAGSGPNELAWWQNIDGSAHNLVKHIITNDFTNVTKIYSVDIDDDSDYDVLGSSYYAGFKWYDNIDASGLSWEEHIIDNSDVASIIAFDYRSDDSMDILSAEWDEDKVILWENITNNGLYMIPNVIDDNFNHVNSVYTSDINYDGRTDIIGAAGFADELAWWEQTEIYLTIELNPSRFPIVIPSTGGYFGFEMQFINTSDEPQWFAAGTETLLPNGYLFSPIQINSCIGIRPNSNFITAFVQEVPGFAPAGEYQYIVRIGRFPGFTLSYDSFSFTKSANTGSGSDRVVEWSLSGWDDSFGSVSAPWLPTHYEVQPAYPNPFNLSSTIEVALPEAADLRVVVYNVAGQQVAELANDQFAAGQHNLTFDAQGLASGLYFIHAIVPGQLNQTQKVMLVR